MHAAIRMMAAMVLAVAPVAAPAQSISDQVKPILAMTEGNWVAVREFDGKDLLYFTHLEVYRCAIEQVRYVLNTGKPEVWEQDNCETETMFAPIDPERLPYVEYPLNSIQSVKVEIEYKDGDVVVATFERGAIMTP